MSALPVALSVDEATRITTKIKLRLETIADNVDAVIPLVEQAKAGDVHVALNFPSWPAYVKETFGGVLHRLSREDRQPQCRCSPRPG